MPYVLACGSSREDLPWVLIFRLDRLLFLDHRGSQTIASLVRLFREARELLILSEVHPAVWRVRIMDECWMRQVRATSLLGGTMHRAAPASSSGRGTRPPEPSTRNRLPAPLSGFLLLLHLSKQPQEPVEHS